MKNIRSSGKTLGVAPLVQTSEVGTVIENKVAR